MPTTFNVTVQLALGASVPLERVIVPAPAAPVAVPPQVLFKLGGFAANKPEGRLSVNAIPFRVAPLFGLLMLKVSVVVPLLGMLAAPNNLVMVGALGTVRVAVLLVLPVPPLLEVTALVVFCTLPDCVPVTFTVNVHVPLLVRANAERLMLVLPATPILPPSSNRPLVRSVWPRQARSVMCR